MTFKKHEHVEKFVMVAETKEESEWLKTTDNTCDYGKELDSLDAFYKWKHAKEAATKKEETI